MPVGLNPSVQSASLSRMADRSQTPLPSRDILVGAYVGYDRYGLLKWDGAAPAPKDVDGCVSLGNDVGPDLATTTAMVLKDETVVFKQVVGGANETRYSRPLNPYIVPA